ncbi:hypothetical protein W02_00730 [Nitrospira sp. KM1]|uniref:hypothetical protein n=1 Tax=Nitrospira sp. KM1 TaxID=1936990 RepID=UPI0013A70DAC|nr:hypothetical protein [Nitrospira sp. KM1]BCA52933.1 hypothetical protein W02_00730 [Nitrospira sp. KM1]
MTAYAPVTDRILGAVRHAHKCDLDTLAQNLPELSWNQVFFEIDRLSRRGDVLVTFEGEGKYIIRLPEHKKSSKPHHERTK